MVPATDFIATLVNSNELTVIVASILSAISIGMIAGSCLGGLWAEKLGSSMMFACVVSAALALGTLLLWPMQEAGRS
jgi:predicted MFS family arabinose efflux permease